MKFTYRNILRVAAMLLCGGSLGCSVALFAMEQPSILGAVLAGVFAGSLELCKFAFFPVGLDVFMREGFWKKITGSGVLVLACFLLFVSVGASVGFFESASVSYDNIKRNSSNEYQSMKQITADIDQEIAAVNRLVELDTGGGYRQRAMDSMKILEALRKEKQSLLAQGENIDPEALASSGAAFKIISKVVGGGEESVRYGVYIAIAVLIDVCGIVALLLVGVKERSVSGCDIGNEVGNETKNEVVELKPEMVQANTKGQYVDSRTGEDLQPVVNKMLSGQYGEKLSFRPIINDWRNIKIKAEQLKELLNQLIDENYVVRKGRFYHLAQGEMLNGCDQ
mgnify:CR=1 FL=1